MVELCRRMKKKREDEIEEKRMPQNDVEENRRKGVYKNFHEHFTTQINPRDKRNSYFVFFRKRLKPYL